MPALWVQRARPDEIFEIFEAGRAMSAAVSLYDISSRVSVLETRIAHTLELLEKHMAREEETTKHILDTLEGIEGRMASVERKLSGWAGVAIGMSLIVSAAWAVVLAAIAYFK